VSTTSQTSGDNHKEIRRVGKDIEHDRLLKEIRIIDKWCNYGANNGLFYKKLNRNYNDKLDRTDENGSIDKKQSDPEVDGEKLYEQIHEELRQAQDTLNDGKYSDSMVCVARARISYLKVLFSKSWKWRFVNMYAGPIWIYLTSFLLSVLAFYIYSFDNIISKTGIEHAAINAVTWGCVGGILRGLWYLKDKVSEREYKNSWWTFFVSVPFLGGIFGAIVYLIIIAGIWSLGVGSTSQGPPDINRPAVIIPITALAGFNWEWAVKLFRRIGDLITSEQTK
jgi:hypothetical protein